jgi:3-methyladenine DNA glycosylase AlkD
MLREIGKRNKEIEDSFLKKYYKFMPRTMLRYAIEKYPEEERQKFLKGEI